MPLRRATSEDAGEIARIHVASWLGAYRGLMPDEILDGLSVVERARAWEDILADAEQPCYVATDQDSIVGFVHVCACRDPDKEPARTGEIAALYIDPKQWNKGYGTALLRQGMEALHDREYSEVTLWVLEDNGPGRAFYEHFGFTVDGARKIHPKSGLVELRYVKQARVG